MCGIAGIYKLNGESINFEAIQRFTDSIAHRGPDGSGYELLNNDTLAFGHRRLSILDLTESGKQPMFFQDRYCITFNGEVYNFIEIKEELLKNGFSFRTETDTEIILAAYHFWGIDAFQRFNGMWALAIWDNTEKKLLLCRDRFGVKPLHFVYSPNSLFAFASETYAFGFLNDFKKEINEENLLFSMINPSALEPTGKTIFNNIEQLLPGHIIQIGSDKKINIKRWWNPNEVKVDIPKSNSEKTEKFFELFKDACKLRLRSDVPIASALSGGLDSSSVFAMVHHLAKSLNPNERLPDSWQKAVVGIFPGTEMDEKVYADQVIDYLHSDVIYSEPDYSNLEEDIISSTKLFDSMTGNPINSVSSIYRTMKKNGITVSLDGHGGDELLYGYKSTVIDLFYHYKKYQKLDSANEIADIYAYMGKETDSEKTKVKLHKLVDEMKNRNVLAKLKDKLLLTESEVSVFEDKKNVPLGDWFKKEAVETLVPFELFKGLKSKYTYIESLAIKDFYIDHIPYNLRDFDRGAMQSGIEIRMPFMDYRLVGYCFALPIQNKVANGYTKLILRDSMKGLLPESIRLRRNKIGLGAPTSSWFNNQLAEFICDEVASASFLNSSFWQGDKIRDFVVKTTREKAWDNNTANKFWKVINAHIIINK